MFKKLLKWLLSLVKVNSATSSNIELEIPTVPSFEPIKPIIKSNRERLYDKAVECLGKDVTPDDNVPDNFDCAETVNVIHKMTFGDEIGGGASTYQLYKSIKLRKDFIEVFDPLAGDVIISPTGLGSGVIPNGHVGIIGNGGIIMSNASSTGLFDTKYNLETWKARYQELGGFPVCFFRKL